MSVLRKSFRELLTTSYKPVSIDKGRPCLRWTSTQQQSPWSGTSLTVYQKKSIEYYRTRSQKSMEILRNQATRAVTFYEEFTGLKELKEAQERVLIATKLLKEAQDRRREARAPLNLVQKKLQDFQPELRNTPRDDDRYLQLIKDEHQLMKEIKFLQQQLQEAENDEREAFELLSTSLRTSHEAERVQAEKTKYFSIIASILGTVIGVLGSSIINRQRMSELKELVSVGSQNLEEFFTPIQGNLEKIDRRNEIFEENLVKISSELERIRGLGVDGGGASTVEDGGPSFDDKKENEEFLSLDVTLLLTAVIALLVYLKS